MNWQQISNRIQSIDQSMGFQSQLQLIIAGLLILASGFIGPWWLFTVAPFGLTLWIRNRSATLPLGLAGLASVVWLVALVVQDARFGFRLSSRLAGVLGLPSRIFIYLGIMMMVFVLSWMASRIAQVLFTSWRAGK